VTANKTVLSIFSYNAACFQRQGDQLFSKNGGKQALKFSQRGASLFDLHGSTTTPGILEDSFIPNGFHLLPVLSQNDMASFNNIPICFVVYEWRLVFGAF
jgi:hypothetical protein